VSTDFIRRRLNDVRPRHLNSDVRLLLNGEENDMNRMLLILTPCICFLISLSSASASRRASETIQWGQPHDGVQMSLTSTGSNLQLALRNMGDRDVTLNLGVTLANGKVQLPNNINLNFTDAQGKTRLFRFADKRYPGVAGRLDDYVVPLRAGLTYTLQLTLDQFWCYETKEFSIRLLPGTNYLTAQFEGTGAKLANLDMPAIKFMNFWLGRVESNTLTLER
jgi:hypothetical protein